MRPRTYFALLSGLVALVLVSFLVTRNQGLLAEPFSLGGNATLPLYLVLVLVFLVGFLPPGTVLLVSWLRRDLAARDDRRRQLQAESLDRSFQRGLDLLVDEQWERAAGELSTVVEERPDDLLANLRYGEALRRQGRVEEALEVHRKAAAEHPLSIAAIYQIIADYETRGESEVAREVRNRVLREFPGMGLKVLRRRRNAAVAAGRWETAWEIQQQIDKGMEPPADDEERELIQGLSYQKGVAILEADDAEAALELFVALIDQEPRFVPARIMRGEAKLLQGDAVAAQEVWLNGYRETGSPVFLQRLEDHFIESGEPRPAIALLRRLIASSDDDLLPRFFLGRLYQRLEMHQEALDTLAGLAGRLGSSPSYHCLLGRVYQRLGNSEAALRGFNACLRELGLPQKEYQCRSCQARYSSWLDRCDRCGAWNGVELDFVEEPTRSEARQPPPLPVWTVPEARDVIDLERLEQEGPAGGDGAGSNPDSKSPR